MARKLKPVHPGEIAEDQIARKVERDVQPLAEICG
jgi:plasmid maintenance system antidote protein VapI